MLIQDDCQRIRDSAGEPRASSERMTKYEFNQIVSLRVTHLAKSAVPLVELPPSFTVATNLELRAVALRELREGRLPYIVKRVMPNGKIEHWRVADLDLCAVRHLMRD
jgi:DNA-directed RNA polymerase I, II, and III subunit RPABC2